MVGTEAEPVVAGDSIKPGVKRSGTPGSSTQILAELAERAIARVRLQERIGAAVGRSAGAWSNFVDVSWGSAALHPRL